MAYSNGDNVDITPDIAFEIVSPAGIPSGGVPCTLACAFTPAVDATNDTLAGLVRNSGNHWVGIRYTSGLSGPGTTTSIQLNTQAGGGGTNTNASTSAVVTEGQESIVVCSFSSLTSWAAVIDSNAYETFTPTTNGTPSLIDTFEAMQKRGAEFLPGNVAWIAAWWSALAQADMENIADGTDPPTDHSPDEFIWFVGTTAYDNEAETSSPTTIGAGSLATGSNTYPGWPPSAGDVVPYVRQHPQRIVRHTGRYT